MGLLTSSLFGFWIATKRLWASRWLVLAVFLGQVTAVALVVAVPLFAEGTSRSLLERRLRERQDPRPPFAFVFGYIGQAHGPLTLGEYRAATAYLGGELPQSLGLPALESVSYAQSDSFTVFPSKSSLYADSKQSLTWGHLAFMSGIDRHVSVVEGSLPRVTSPEEGPLEVLVCQDLASQIGVQAGEELVLYTIVRGLRGRQEGTIQIPIRVAGVWVPRDAQEGYWPIPPSGLTQVFLVPEESFANHLASIVEKPVVSALWYTLFDGRRLRSAQVDTLLARISRGQAAANARWPGVALTVSPKERLIEYRQATRLLTVLLYIASWPTLGLLVYFIAFVAGQMVQSQQLEIATLRSRGVSYLQLAGLYLLEGLPLTALATALGVPVGSGIASLMGRINAFLDWSGLPSFQATPGWDTLVYALLAAALAMLTTLGPAMVASRRTIVTYKTEISRTLPAPAWQRHYLDLLLLIPPLYGYYLMRQGGKVPVLGWGLQSGDPYQNPLLFVVPTLFILAWGLVASRLFPALMGLLSALGGRLVPVWLLLAQRHLARSTWLYRGPLLLLILTVSLATFTASMAATFDDNVTARAYYQVGADLKLVEPCQVDPQSLDDIINARVPAGTLPRWLFYPLQQHTLLPGVTAATRIADLSAQTEFKSKGTLIGIDRLDYPRVGYFRDDFSPEPLGALLNRLALRRDGLLVSRSFLQDSGLAIGERTRLTVDLYPRLPLLGVRTVITGTVAGVLDLFPAVDPSRGPFFVANLDYLFERIGGRLPYEVLLATAPDADTAAIVAALRDQGVSVSLAEDARALVRAERERPEQRGTFGILSIGFVASAALTVLGFLLYSFASLRRRLVELGVLRTLGLSVGQLNAALACEQLLLLVSGLAAGTGLGVGTSALFIPYLQVGGSLAERLPPYVVRIAWGDIGRIYLLFATMLLVATVGLLASLRRFAISRAIKMGEQML